MHPHSMGTEAIRAFFTLQCSWLNDEDVFLNPADPQCGSAATYLIYFTHHHIQHLMLDFIARFPCSQSGNLDLLDVPHFEQDYNHFLELLEKEVNFYARRHHDLPRQLGFEDITSIFTRTYGQAC